MRIEDEYGLLEFATERTNGSGLVCIPCHERKTVNICPHRIDKSRDGKIYVRSFLFKFNDPCQTGMCLSTGLALFVDMGHPHLLLAIESFNNFNAAERSKCLEINLLSFLCHEIMRIGAHMRSEEFDGQDYTDIDSFIADVSDALYTTEQYDPNTDLSDLNEGHQVSWEWPFEVDDEKDTALGDAAADGDPATISISLNATVTQID